MNLTDILLFGKAIIGDGGSSDTTQVIIDTDLIEADGLMLYEATVPNGTKLINGQRYTVTLGENVYTTKAVASNSGAYLGNAFLLGEIGEEIGEDTGEPFLYLQEWPQEQSDKRVGEVVVVTNGATHITVTLAESSDSSSDNGIKMVSWSPNTDDVLAFPRIDILYRIADACDPNELEGSRLLVEFSSLKTFYSFSKSDGTIIVDGEGIVMLGIITNDSDGTEAFLLVPEDVADQVGFPSGLYVPEHFMLTTETTGAPDHCVFFYNTGLDK